MRKSRKFIIILCILSLILSIVGCDNNKQQEELKNNCRRILINSFESTQDMDTSLVKGVLGKVSINKEPQFIKEGQGSAKVTVIHDPYVENTPVLFQSFNLIKKQVDLTDFANIGNVVMYVYNNQNTTQQITLQLCFTKGEGERINYDLKPQSWTKVVLNVEREYIPAVQEMNKKEKLCVDGLNIIFNRLHNSDAIYYIDDITLLTTEKSYQKVQMVLDENEICSFDKSWQAKTLILENSNFPIITPSVKLERKITSTNGGNSLKVYCPGGIGSSAQTFRWPGVALNTEMLKLVKWKEYNDSARICFDVFVPEEDGLDILYFSLYAGYDDEKGELLHSTRFFNAEGIRLIPGVWTHVSYSVSQINASPEATKDYNFANTKYVVFRWDEFVGSEKVVYIDNIHMEI